MLYGYSPILTSPLKCSIQMVGYSACKALLLLGGVRLILRTKLVKNRGLNVFILTLCDKYTIYCHIWKRKVSHLL
jgi:hypothetical protein